MRSLDRARQHASRYRPHLGSDPERRLERLTAYLQEHHGLQPRAVSKDFLQGGRGEVAPQEGFLYYDAKLDKKPRAKLELFAHELGHLVLHSLLTQTLEPGDPIRGSAFLEHGPPALARYSRKSFEEDEAVAFAAELLCPADEVFDRWRADPRATTTSLAELFGVSLGMLRVQLAEGLYRRVSGSGQGEPEGGADAFRTNEDQEKAATWMGSPVLVEAGPGTGKTRTLVRRVIHLVRERSVKPEDVLVLTFSNEAAEELRTRLMQSLGEASLGEDPEEILVATFHGLGIIVLRGYGHLVGLGADFAVLDDISREEILSEILGKVECEAILNFRNPQETVRRAAYFIGYLKDRLYTPERFAEELERHDGATVPGVPGGAEARALCRVFTAYEKEKKRLDRVDFADLVLLPLRILQEHPEVREQFREHCAWVLVDEYQDVSRSMAMLLQEICGAENPPWVVGDARQAIYRFRGAAPENVHRFSEDFPGGQTFLIGLNYRSSPPIIDAANHLAALLEDDKFSPASGDPPRRWSPGSSVEPLSEDPITIVEAASDAAERHAIALRVRAWLDQGISANEIGVLARRNIDVRNIALALSQAGIRAITSGLVTAEGAAGDLAAAVTLLDTPRAAIPRLAFAVGRGRAGHEHINAAVRFLLAELRAKASAEEAAKDEAAKKEAAKDEAAIPMPQLPASPETRQVIDAVHAVSESLRSLAFSGDGWAVLCGFLFDAGSYLRRLLQDESGLEAALALEEIVSALAFAGSYRFSHPGVAPRRSRRRMAERFRELLCSAIPGLIPPRPQVGAVRVMTCHASKGLEFPCVIVAGQTLNRQMAGDSWLPSTLRDDPDEELRQADSLLFVGVTRAQRALVVSFARTAGGTVRSPKRTLPALLKRWIESQTVPLGSCEVPIPPSLPVEIGPIWGADPPERMSMYALSGRQCALRGYLEDDLRIRIRSVVMPLYPAFARFVGQALRRVAEEANTRGGPLSPKEAEAIAAEEWPEDKYDDHPHIEVYRPRALRQIREFAESYRPAAVLDSDFEKELTWKEGDRTASLPLGLLARYRDPTGNQVAVLFRPESQKTDKESLNWSDLSEHYRLPLVLLHEEDPDLHPYVYSGEDGRFFPYKWSAQKPKETLAKVAEKAHGVFEARSRGEFQATIKDWTCDRCTCRMLCPFWIGATGD